MTATACSTDGCDRPARARRMCPSHYHQARREAGVSQPARVRPDTTGAPTVELLAKVLAGVPRLPGRAACRDHIELFDRAADGCPVAAEEAAGICGACSVLNACAEWIARAHPQRPPPGVWAARLRTTTQSRKATQ